MKRGPSLIGSLGLSCRYKKVIFVPLGCSSLPSPYTFSIPLTLSPSKQGRRRAGSPVSYYVSLVPPPPPLMTTPPSICSSMFGTSSVEVARSLCQQILCGKKEKEIVFLMKFQQSSSQNTEMHLENCVS
jgi:hypothetical protein